MLIAQNSVEQKDLGAASGAATFFRSIGGSFGLSLFGAIFSNRFADSPAGKLLASTDGGGGEGGGVDPAALRQLPAQVRDVVFSGLANSISAVFVWSVAFAIVVPVLAWFIKEIPLRGGPNAGPDDKQSSEEQAEAALASAPAMH
jgi:hypothetical protein